MKDMIANRTGWSEMVPAFLRPAPDSIVAMYRRCDSNPHWHALNLLWSLWVFFTPLVEHVGARFWWSIALGYPLFVLLYALIQLRPRREAGYYVSGMALLAFVSMPFNPSSWSYAVFACVLVPYRDSLISTAMRVVLITLLIVLEALWLGFPWFVMVLMVAVCTSAASGSLAGRINMMKNVAQRMSQNEVRRLATAAERERIGRDLHDLLGHTLSLITLKLELSRKLFDRDHEAARRELTDAEQIARNALTEVRAAVTGIRAANLAAELASAHLLLETSGVVMRYEPPSRTLPTEIETMLALVVREAATNIARHSGATQASIEAELDDSKVRLYIRDNGRGGVDAFGNGLSGMRERARALGGDLSVDSPSGRGTTLCIEVPLPSARPARSYPEADADDSPGMAPPMLGDAP